MNRKILLVGGAGYIGTMLSSYLLQRGYSIKVLDAFLYKNGNCVLPYLANPNYEFILGDLASVDIAKSALSGVTDVIILAGLVGDPITKKYPDQSNRINLDGMKHFIGQLTCFQLNKVIFISTCSNYGLIQVDVLADENTALKPLSLYAKAKVEIEEFILAKKNKISYCPTILRFATAFGLSPRMRFDLSVNEFVRELYLGNELVVYDHETWRPYCHVLDFARALEAVLEAPKEKVAFEVFNAGSEKNNYTKKMIVDEVLAHIPNGQVRYQQHGSDPRNYRVNFNKIQKTLNFEAKYSVADGIQEILSALRKNCFVDVSSRPNFYGNYEIAFEVTQVETV